MKIKKFRSYAALVTLIAGLSLNPMLVNAEEEVLYTEENDNYEQEEITDEVTTETPSEIGNGKEENAETETETTEQVTITVENWNPAEHPTEGWVIPDYVKTEAERKGIEEITEEPPTETPNIPETPQIYQEPPRKSIPKTDNSLKGYLSYALGIIIISFTGLTLEESFRHSRVAKKWEKEKNESKVVAKRKFRKRKNKEKVKELKY